MHLLRRSIYNRATNIVCENKNLSPLVYYIQPRDKQKNFVLYHLLVLAVLVG